MSQQRERQVLQDPDIIRRAADWYVRCLERIENEQRREAAQQDKKTA